MIDWKDMEGPIPLLPTKAAPLSLVWNSVYAPINLHYNISSRSYIKRGSPNDTKSEIEIIRDIQTYFESQTFSGSGYGMII